MKLGFQNLIVGLAVGIVGIVVAASVLSGLYPTLYNSLAVLSNASSATPVPLGSILSPTGVIPIVLVAVFVIAIIVGLFAMMKGKEGR
jgi:hypothetical protein